MKRLIALFLVLSMTFAIIGCPSAPHVFDEKTARHWDEGIALYIEDIARVAGVDDPDDLKPEHFPIVTVPRNSDGTPGDPTMAVETITWDEFDAAYTALKSYRDYEYNKRTKDGREITKPEDE